jgi:hypothetical protein
MILTIGVEANFLRCLSMEGYGGHTQENSSAKKLTLTSSHFGIQCQTRAYLLTLEV